MDVSSLELYFTLHKDLNSPGLFFIAMFLLVTFIESFCDLVQLFIT